MKAAAYYRQNKNWKNYLGRVGRVVVSTMIHVGSQAQESFLPYSYAVVDFGKEGGLPRAQSRGEFMGVANEELAADDKVVCVLRKIGISDKAGIISYGIKVKKL